jgi:hypothetical protein
MVGAVGRVLRRRRRPHRLLAPLAALGLLVIIVVAIATSGRQRIKLYKPIDTGDSHRRLALFTGDALRLYVDCNHLGRRRDEPLSTNLSALFACSNSEQAPSADLIFAASRRS